MPPSASREWVSSVKNQYKPFVRTDEYGLTGRDGPPLTFQEAIRATRRLAAYVGLLLWYSVFLTMVTIIFPEHVTPRIVETVTKPFVKLLIYSLGFEKIEVKGEIDPQSVVLVSNHVSYMDILVMGCLYFPSFVAKASLKKAPIVGKLAVLMKCIFIPETGRTGGGSGASAEVISRIRLLDEKKACGDAYNPILIFAEGTTSNGVHLLPFRTAAFAAGVPVQPVLIQFTYERFNPSYEAISFKTHIVRMAAQPSNKVTVTLLPVVDPPKELTESIVNGKNGVLDETRQRATAKAFANDVRETIAAQGKLAFSDLTFKDKKDYHTMLKERGYA